MTSSTLTRQFAPFHLKKNGWPKIMVPSDVNSSDFIARMREQLTRRNVLGHCESEITDQHFTAGRGILAGQYQLSLHRPVTSDVTTEAAMQFLKSRGEQLLGPRVGLLLLNACHDDLPYGSYWCFGEPGMSWVHQERAIKRHPADIRKNEGGEVESMVVIRHFDSSIPADSVRDDAVREGDKEAMLTPHGPDFSLVRVNVRHAGRRMSEEGSMGPKDQTLGTSDVLIGYRLL